MIQDYEMLKYRNLNLETYQNLGIMPKIEEISCTFANFHKVNVKLKLKSYSLHTEPSLVKINNAQLNAFPALMKSLYRKKADLWVSMEWAKDFFHLILTFINNNKLPNPLIIEIHPPYRERVSLEDFFENYLYFENKITALFSDVNILIENRNYGGDFCLSVSEDYKIFSEKIKNKKLKLRLIVDIAQLFGKEFEIHGKNLNTLNKAFRNLSESHDYIRGIHICGKSHRGNFDSIFHELTDDFYGKFKEFSFLLKDKIYIVPEIFSKKDFIDIVSDLKKYQIL